MKLKFDPSLSYQEDAINAVVKIFDGQPTVQGSYEVSHTTDIMGMQLSELGAIGNALTFGIDPEGISEADYKRMIDQKLLDNVHAAQAENDITQTPTLQGREFSTEMETGTGKTYVYLRSIFELNRKYGFKKFVIVVPSVAIREGVLKSIEITKDHFKTLYNNIAFDHFVYDSKKLGKVRQFATSNQIQIMVINIQAFQKAENIMNQERDTMSGRMPIEYIQATRPFVIIDEPQSVDNTPKSKEAIKRLNPIATLRYSATHKSPYNLLYKLDPIRAYDLRLVKRIEVASIKSDDDFNQAYVKLLKADNSNGIKAQVEIHKKSGASIKPAKVWVKQNDDLYVKSGERSDYQQGYEVAEIDSTPGFETITFSNGRTLELGEEVGGTRDEVMKAQIRETIEQHLKKERILKKRGIKVLSLFFIDKVANYRVYNDDGSTDLGQFGIWFEEAYKELTATKYKDVIPFDVSQVHDGYFSMDNKGRAKDTRGNTAADEDTYSKIMRNKEQLLDADEPLRFIFSHSALKEGWDNPNVFQICTLNETQSVDRKRQEIGRGLRLPVNADGERVHDEHINRLTVIANESYEEFARKLQTEFEEDFGTRFGCVDQIAFSKLIISSPDGEDTPLGQDASIRLWDELKDNGYIDEEGRVLPKFNPQDMYFELKTSDEFKEIRAAVIDEVRKFTFQDRIKNARDQHNIKLRKEVQLVDDFKDLWDRIKFKTRYRVKFDTEKLIYEAVQAIKAQPPITAPRLHMAKAEVEQTKAGFSTDKVLEYRDYKRGEVKVLPDILSFLQKETELTRHTIVSILKKSGRLDEFKINPQEFMAMVSKSIARTLHTFMMEGLEYEKIADHSYEMTQINEEAEKGITRYLSNLYMVQNTDKALFDAIECDSEVERQFARDLDNNENVKLFVKLPSWFKIDTPIGAYNPDWAFVTEDEEKLYFVRETKSTIEREKLRESEHHKIECGRKHFTEVCSDMPDFSFDVVTSLKEVTGV